MRNDYSQSFSAFSIKISDAISVAVLFLFFRLAGLYFFHPVFSGSCPLEEYYRGAMAQDLIERGWSSYWNSRPDLFAGGSLVMGVLAAIFFKLFGSSAFVLKTIPVLISLGALLIWFGILFKEYSQKTAWYFALFFIFAPSSFQTWSMVPLGDHYETMLISAVAVWLFLKMEKGKRGNEGIEGDKGKKDHGFSYPLSLTPYPFLLGMVCGFGVWFAYIYALTVAALLLVWFRRNPRFIFSAAFWIFAFGFLAGFSFWLISNIQNHFPGLMVHGGSFLKHLQPIHHPDFWIRYGWRFSFLNDYFQFFNFPASDFGMPAYFLKRAYGFFLMIPALLIWRISKRSEAAESNRRSVISVYFGTYVVLHAAALQVTDFTGIRFVMPVLPALFFFWARMMDHLENWRSPLTFWIRVFFGAPVLMLGLFSTFVMISPAHAGDLLRTRGVAYDFRAYRTAGQDTSTHRSPESCLESWNEEARQIPQEERSGYWNAAAQDLAQTVVTEKVVKLPDLESFPPQAQAAFYFHLGGMIFSMRQPELEEAEQALSELVSLDHPGYPLAKMGILYAFESERSWDSAPPQLNSEKRQPFLRAAGIRLMQETYQDPVSGLHRAKEKIQALQETDRVFVYQGIGQALEISRLFFAEPCEDWKASYFHTDPRRDSEVWIRQGEALIRNLLQVYEQKISHLSSKAIVS